MKSALSLVLLLLLTTVIHAQDQYQYVLPCGEHSLFLKLAPAAIMVGKISLGSEYNIGRRRSVTFYAGIPVPVQHSIDYSEQRPSNMELKTFSVMAGYKYYLSERKQMKGFYFEPFLKYVDHRGNGLLNDNLGTKSVSLDTKESFRNFGLGAQLGVQFMISNKIVIDWFLFGPEISIASFSSHSYDITSSTWSEQDAAQIAKDIQDVLDDIPLIGKKVELDVNNTQKTITGKYNGFLPGLRTGLSVGYRF